VHTSGGRIHEIDKVERSRVRGHDSGGSREGCCQGASREVIKAATDPCLRGEYGRRDAGYSGDDAGRWRAARWWNHGGEARSSRRPCKMAGKKRLSSEKPREERNRRRARGGATCAPRGGTLDMMDDHPSYKLMYNKSLAVLTTRCRRMTPPPGKCSSKVSLC
jgi:hypothetical protein